MTKQGQELMKDETLWKIMMQDLELEKRKGKDYNESCKLFQARLRRWFGTEKEDE